MSINKIPFNPFLHKIHSKRANERQVVRSICTFFCERKEKLAKKQNKKEVNQGKLIKSLNVSDLKIICFIICNWTHKRIRLVLRGHNRGKKSLHHHYGTRFNETPAGQGCRELPEFVFFLSKFSNLFFSVFL